MHKRFISIAIAVVGALVVCFFVFKLLTYPVPSSQDVTQQHTNQSPIENSPSNEKDIKNFILERQDNHSTMTMKQGDELLLQLGDGEWKATIFPQDILELIPNMPTIKGVQGIYKAFQPGTTTITASSQNSTFKAVIIVEK